ncbi:MAG: hypothetical protein ABI600_01170 [Luteolibacter sp.]
MSRPCAIGYALLAMTAVTAWGEDLLDRLDDTLTFSGFNDQLRARVSGTLDLEYYNFSDAAPGLIFSDDSYLLNSRLSLFFDAQVGPKIYLFSQARVDQGFDPSDHATQARLDEYALRWTPSDDGRFNVQIGRFATVVGNYVQRHQSWENPFINAPLIYENLTGIYDAEAPSDAKAFSEILVDAKYEYNPVIWGPSYATGISVSGQLGKFDYAAEIKNASLSSRPETWDAMDSSFDHPTVSARVAYRPNMAWVIGFSASEGPYFTDQARSTLPPGTGINDFNEMVLGQDVSFAWSHWQFWAEVYEARFDVPNVGNADTLGYYLEAKYKFTPNLFGALRWNQQMFGDVPNGLGSEHPWGNGISRSDAALTYRFTPHTQLKLQYSLQHEDHLKDEISQLVAAQFTLRF